MGSKKCKSIGLAKSFRERMENLGYITKRDGRTVKYKQGKPFQYKY